MHTRPLSPPAQHFAIAWDAGDHSLRSLMSQLEQVVSTHMGEPVPLEKGSRGGPLRWERGNGQSQFSVDAFVARPINMGGCLSRLGTSNASSCWFTARRKVSATG